nr:universal stress protein [uncultured Mogibacterium sp.]
MKRILVPVDGSPRSLIALEQLKTTFSPKAFEVVLVMVRENTGYALSLGEEAEIREELDKKLNAIAKTIDKYSVIKRAVVGRAGARVIEAAKEFGVDMIVMTKSTKPGAGSTIGLTASYIIRHAQCDVMVVKETESKKIESYRGAIYKRAKGTVALRGQLSLKQSECLIPSVKGDVIYHIDVTRGRIRFLHRSFNPVTKDWELPPSNGQQEVYEIEAGVSIQIPVNATGDGKMADRIRILNRSMKTEAVFNYEITADKRSYKQESKPERSEEEVTHESEETASIASEVVAPVSPVAEEDLELEAAYESEDSVAASEETTKEETETTELESILESKEDDEMDEESEEVEGASADAELIESGDAEDVNLNSIESLDEIDPINTIAAIEGLCATGAIDAVELIKALDEMESKSEAQLELDADAELMAEAEGHDK